jgi:hypothetical protein
MITKIIIILNYGNPILRGLNQYTTPSPLVLIWILILINNLSPKKHRLRYHRNTSAKLF